MFYDNYYFQFYVNEGNIKNKKCSLALEDKDLIEALEHDIILDLDDNFVVPENNSTLDHPEIRLNQTTVLSENNDINISDQNKDTIDNNDNDSDWIPQETNESSDEENVQFNKRKRGNGVSVPLELRYFLYNLDVNASSKMNCKESKIRKKNPREGANWISLLTFFFVFDIIRKGSKKELSDDDIFEVLKMFESEKLGNRLESEWKKELQKKNPSLLLAMFRMFGAKYFLLSIFIFTYETTLVTVLEPLLIGKVTSYFEIGKNMTVQEGSLYVLGLTGSSVLLCLCNNIFLLNLLSICLKMRIAITSLIYRKSLKLNSAVSSSFIGGRAVNLITKDVSPFFDGADCAQMIIVGIPQFMVMLVVAYKQIGLAAISGASVIIVLIPINILLGKLTSKYRLKTASKTDQRVKVTQEILTTIRIIKMYTWELFFSNSVHKLRKMEIKDLRMLFYIKATALSIGQLSSRLAFYICVMTYIGLGNHITAEKAFVVIGCFGAVRAVLTTYMPLGVAQIADMRASLQRITNFLMLDEVQGTGDKEFSHDTRISVEHVTFKRLKNLTVLDDIHFKITKNLTLLMGPTGSGKSTLLKLLLGDIRETTGNVCVSGKMSYASQEPWLFPATVHQNILFGEPFNKNRYDNVIKVCALKKDIESLPHGDKTLVTDRGLNLSKGQKVRINLARAVYKQADIYLLDDSLSSVDSRVGHHIFNECIKHFLKDRMCVLVTHNPHLMSAADQVIVLNKGLVQFNGDYNDYVKSNDNGLKDFLKHNEDTTTITCAKTQYEVISNDLDSANELSSLLSKSTEANIYEETNQVGSVNKKIYYEYFSSAGGFKVFLIVLFTFVLSQATSSWSDYFVSFWVDMEQELTGFRLNHTTNSTEYIKLEESHDRVMKSYSFVMLAAAIFTFLRSFTFFIFSSKASTNIHNSVLDNILNSVMTFFDSNLSGNVLNRFSRDLGVIDDYMPGIIFECINVILQVLAVFFVVSSVNLYFIIPSIIFATVLYFARRLYIPTGRSLRRLEGATRSPLIGHLNATLEGLTTIRASQAQIILRREFDKHQDLFSSVVYMNIVTTRAFALYLDLTCVCYIAVITLTFLFFKNDTLAGKVGLAITQSFNLTGLLQWGIRAWAELENQMTCTERVLEYKNVKVEDKSGAQLENWPSKGSIMYKNVNLKYATCNESVLKNLCFDILDKEKIGIVGRTGAGKTSIISALFRMYDFDGTITIDNVDIKTLSINNLRSKISIIPQDPILFSGTIRTNLDPYSEHSDEVLWASLDKVKMKDCIKDLNDEIQEGGSDLSVGERQLFCLARAVVRNNSILVLDEATANIDSQTDALIQNTIKKLFSHCTVITIAHKLQTVLDSDKILVMDFGKIIQFGPPQDLLTNKNGLFYNMVKDAGIL
ncbi:hypothetical protein RN001_008088 [Aquatica leii]|uniref:Multidrug resistance-associated protein lethal(2)03659 n=1 Tax=Aquatica leii TaxID=1421715 RepID=A0AAN7P993_9COLE|nr:hypothetical protein RN001_008088 [Aquatica leii]